MVSYGTSMALQEILVLTQPCVRLRDLYIFIGKPKIVISLHFWMLAHLSGSSLEGAGFFHRIHTIKITKHIPLIGTTEQHLYIRIYFRKQTKNWNKFFLVFIIKGSSLSFLMQRTIQIKTNEKIRESSRKFKDLMLSITVAA